MRIPEEDIVAYEIDGDHYCPDCFAKWRHTQLPGEFELKREHIVTRDDCIEQVILCDECDREIKGVMAHGHVASVPLAHQCDREIRSVDADDDNQMPSVDEIRDDADAGDGQIPF